MAWYEEAIRKLGWPGMTGAHQRDEHRMAWDDRSS